MSIIHTIRTVIMANGIIKKYKLWNDKRDQVAI